MTEAAPFLRWWWRKQGEAHLVSTVVFRSLCDRNASTAAWSDAPAEAKLCDVCAAQSGQFASIFVGAQIRAARRAKKLSQEELAALTGITQGLLAEIERGCDTKLSTLVRIAGALGEKLEILHTAAPPVARTRTKR